MVRTPFNTVLSVALLAFACATSPQKTAPPASQPPLPRSSIAAVLEHRRELELSDEQVRRLQDLDDQLERANAAIRQEADKRQAGGQPLSRPSRGGMGGRSRGGMGRSGGEGRSPTPSPSVPKSAEERIDDNDTNAYLEAEKLLTESQRPLALEIASRFREESWDRQHAANSK